MLQQTFSDRPTVDDLMSLPQLSLRVREKKVQEASSRLKKRDEDITLRESLVTERESQLSIREIAMSEREATLGQLLLKSKGECSCR